MSIFEDLTQEVLYSLEGYARDVNVYGTVASTVAAGDSTISTSGGVFADGSGFTPGIIEVGEELVYAQALNRTTGVFSGCLRGWRGTTAVEHPPGTLIADNPKFPRSIVKRAINDTIIGVFPRLYAVGTVSAPSEPDVTTITLPSTALNVLAVSWDGYTGSSFVMSTMWRYSAHTGGKTLDVADVPVGRTITVLYSKQPVALVNNSDQFTATGLEEWARDVIVYGALWRLSAGTDMGSVGYTVAEQSSVSSDRKPVLGMDFAKSYMQIYEARLAAAEERIQELYPAVKHRIW